MNGGLGGEGEIKILACEHFLLVCLALSAGGIHVNKTPLDAGNLTTLIVDCRLRSARMAIVENLMAQPIPGFSANF